MSILAFTLAFSFSAQATVYGGNPPLELKVDRPAHDLSAASVTIEKLRVNYCGGGYTDYAVDSAEDLVAGYSRTITGGDLCGVRVYWSSPMTIESPTFLLEYDSSYTDVYITSGPQPASLTPFSVLEGSIYGGGPLLLVTLG